MRVDRRITATKTFWLSGLRRATGPRIIIAMATITYDIMDNVRSPSEWWNGTEREREKERQYEESSASSGS